MALPNLLFIDTNIWLDFYRARNETGLQLLKRVEAVANRLIVTYQLESEFKKNRQAAILEGLQELKMPPQIARPGIFSDAKATKAIVRHLEETEKQVKKLHTQLIKALENPAKHDPVYKVCQRIFQKTDELTLRRENPARRSIRRSALRRFLHGCPPRKERDTSHGDGFNWEWMVRCAQAKKAGLVIVSRDSDYGITVRKQSYINDELRHEFSDRVSQTRKLVLHYSLSDALKSFDVPVSAKEEEAEKELLSAPVSAPTAFFQPYRANSLAALFNQHGYPSNLNSLAALVNQSGYLSNINSLAALVNQSGYLSNLNSLAALVNQPGYSGNLNSLAAALGSQSGIANLHNYADFGPSHTSDGDIPTQPVESINQTQDLPKQEGEHLKEMPGSPKGETDKDKKP